jgi:L-ribulokinase
VCSGGIAEKNPVLMQIYADVTGRAMHVAGSSQTCALGSAIAAAVLAGQHADFASAQAAMTSLKPAHFEPNPANRQVYDRLYALYRELHDSFGGLTKAADLSRIMKDLIGIKYAQRAAA